ncbi:MAG: hypothetical protein R6V84_08765 [Desulfobacterales bacterium]
MASKYLLRSGYDDSTWVFELFQRSGFSCPLLHLPSLVEIFHSRFGPESAFLLFAAAMASQRFSLRLIENFTSYQEDKFWRKKSLTITNYDLSRIFERLNFEGLPGIADRHIWGRVAEKTQNMVGAGRHRLQSD